MTNEHANNPHDQRQADGDASAAKTDPGQPRKVLAGFEYEGTLKELIQEVANALADAMKQAYRELHEQPGPKTDARDWDAEYEASIESMRKEQARQVRTHAALMIFPSLLRCGHAPSADTAKEAYRLADVVIATGNEAPTTTTRPENHPLATHPT
jgi:hypothetical protein